MLIETLIEEIKNLTHTVNQLVEENTSLKLKLLSYKNKKNSNNSHTPPSKDENRPKKNQSLREQTDKKIGGQPGHEGTTLECSATPDCIIEHKPIYCSCCSEDLSDVPEKLLETRQVIDIPAIKALCTEHRTYRKVCSCGHYTDGSFPVYVAAKVQYGTNVEALAGYLHARQYLPYKRMKEFFNDVMGVAVSTGGIHNILERLVHKATPHYQQIKQRIYKAAFIGTDETGTKVNGKNEWMWTWQNDDLTYITHSSNRGFKTIEDNFTNGLPNTILQHDRFACHFKCAAMHHQICMAHLLRDIKYLNGFYEDCTWAQEIKTLIGQSLQLKKVLTNHDYYGQCEQRKKLEIQLDKLLHLSINKGHDKAISLQKKLLKHQQYILYFLHHPKVPPDNNGSERAIRNIKVKQKISGQFKTPEGAGGFAILRSVIDTIIKSKQNVLNTLTLIAKLGTE